MSGSIQIKNGIFYTVIYVSVNGKKKPKWESTGLPAKGNKKKAEQILRERIHQYELMDDLVYSDATVSDFVRLWLSLAENRVEGTTYLGYKHVCETQILPYFDDKGYKVKDVTREQIQAFLDEKLKNGNLKGKGGLSVKTVKEYKNILSASFKEAMKRDIIYRNPCEFVTLPKASRRPPKFYTKEQALALFAACRSEEIYPIIFLCTIFGMRRSEVLGIRWQSVDFNRRLLTIEHTVVDQEERFEKDRTKTDASFRSYPMSDAVVNLFRDIQKKEALNRKLCGNMYHENDYVFKWEDGRPYRSDFITSRFAKILKKNNLPKIRFHDLRHTCASLMIDEGMLLKDIQEWLGHASIQTTANIYGHLDMSRKKMIGDKMTELFSTAETQGPSSVPSDSV